MSGLIMRTDQVAVTGLGLMTGLGLDLDQSWQGLIEGRSVTRRFSLFDPRGLASPFGVQLPEGAEDLFAAHIKRRSRSHMTRGTMIAVVTARMAVADAGLDQPGAADLSRVGVVVGSTGTGYVPSATSGDDDGDRILRNMSSSPAAWISLAGKYTGPSFVVGTACSSGAYALSAAFSLIASGQSDVVVAGAADSSINGLDVEGFSALMALAESDGDISTASRPFDRTRNGFVIGEGGGFLVLESVDFARRRGARVYAGMSLPGLYSEAYNILSPEPDGAGMAAAMERALQNARIDPGDIDYVNAHGTSTYLNDLYETKALKRVFGRHAATLAVSSTKSMTGHCLGAAAGVEAVVCCLCLQTGIIPPTINLGDPDPELDLDYVPNAARSKALKHVMSNSFAFGGHNGVNVFSRPE